MCKPVLLTSLCFMLFTTTAKAQSVDVPVFFSGPSGLTWCRGESIDYQIVLHCCPLKVQIIEAPYACAGPSLGPCPYINQPPQKVFFEAETRQSAYPWEEYSCFVCLTLTPDGRRIPCHVPTRGFTWQGGGLGVPTDFAIHDATDHNGVGTIGEANNGRATTDPQRR
jgi:hypothetical protein